jgi:L-arabinokinase
MEKVKLCYSHPHPDLNVYLKSLKRDFGGIFAPNRTISIARAPGCLNIMGGIANYTGSTGLAKPVSPSTIVGVQQRTDKRILIKSLGIEKYGMSNIVEFHMDDHIKNHKLKSLEELPKNFNHDPQKQWATHVLGVFMVLANQGYIKEFTQGANIGIRSTIPMRFGLGSSGALQVATMVSVLRAFNIPLDKKEIPGLCKLIENHLVGSLEGVLDQITCMFGERKNLISIQCQPNEMSSQILEPVGYKFVAINSGKTKNIGSIKHIQTRTSIYMGRKILFQKLITQNLQLPSGEYLANISAQEWKKQYKKWVPARIKGKDFMQQYSGHDDILTEIEPDKSYQLKSRTEYPILENYRTHKMIDLLSSQKCGDDVMIKIGNLMYQSHSSCAKNCRLGFKEADLIVRMVQDLGPKKGFFGAKLTGGGDGGVICILVSNESELLLHNIASQYHELTKLEPELFLDSSPGLWELGAIDTKFN